MNSNPKKPRAAKMRNFTDEEIKHKAFSIYKRKLQAGIPEGSPENNTEVNWREAREELKKDQEIIDLAHDTEIKKYIDNAHRG